MADSTEHLKHTPWQFRPAHNSKPLAAQLAGLAAGVSLCLLSSAQAQVMEADEPEGAAGPETVEEVVVTGIRASLRDAIDLKKQAGTMMDAIVAEDVSKFPDKNVTEALQRVTGVQITRDFGEGAGINIRGMEAGLTRIEFDGVSALGGGSRDVSLTDTASELIKVLNVIKGSEARITEGGIGGTVQLEMRKANDFDDHFFSASFEQEYNDVSEEFSPDLNLTGVYKVNDNFGVMANINASNKRTMIHALRNTAWSRWGDYDQSPEKSVVDPDYADVAQFEDCLTRYGPNGSDKPTERTNCEKQWWDFGPDLPRYGIWARDENRISTNIGFGWQVTDRLSLYSDITYNERDKTAEDFNLQFDTGSSRGVRRDSVVVDANHSIRGFTSQDAKLTNRTLNFAWLQKKSLFKLGADYIGEKFELKGIVATSRSHEDIDSRDTHIESEGVAGVRVTLDEVGAPEFDLTSGFRYQDPTVPDPGGFETFNVNTPESYNSRARFKYAPATNKQTEDSAKVDFTYFFDQTPFIKSVRTGARWAMRSLEAENFQENIIRDVGVSYAAIDADGNLITDANNDPVLMEWTQADQNNIIRGALQTTPRFFPSFDLGIGTLENYQAVDTDILARRLQDVAGTSISRNNLNPRSGKYYIEEQTYAAYLQVDFDQDLGDMRFWGNLGVRYVQTETLSEGDVVIQSRYDINDEGLLELWDWDGTGAVDYNATPTYDRERVTDDNGTFYGTLDQQTFNDRDTSEGSYNDVLPSINLNLGIVPEVLTLYLGAAKVMSSPEIGTLNINASCTRLATLRSREPDSDARNTCKAGNPDIEPYRATQMDVALTWYLNDDSMISAAYFTKELTSYLGPNTVFFDVDYFAGGVNGGVLYDVTQPSNITGVTTKGIELQARATLTMLPTPFNNLGIDVNLTNMTAADVPYTSELDGTPLPLLGQSENSFNLSGFYEDDNWSVRVAYNYRDVFLKSQADQGDNPVYVEDAGHLDAKVSYTVGDTGFTIFADARNLLSAVHLETAGEGRLSDLQWAGRTYALGFSYQM